MRRAVGEFLAGPWSRRAGAFILCISRDLRSATEARERERRRSYEQKIDFSVWDAPALCTRLKAHAELVGKPVGDRTHR